MADNTIGEYSSKSEDHRNFVEGEEREYAFEPNSNPSYLGKIKPYNESKLARTVL